MQSFDRNVLRQWLPAAGLTGLVVVMLFKIALAAGAPPVTAPQQDVIRLETRLNQMEQRLYSIDTSLRNLEQQSRLGNSTSRGSSAPEVEILRSQIQTLQLRLAEDECALAKLDERTLSQTVRNSKRPSGGRTDPCRMNFDTPLRLPDRNE